MPPARVNRPSPPSAMLDLPRPKSRSDLKRLKAATEQRVCNAVWSLLEARSYFTAVDKPHSWRAHRDTRSVLPCNAHLADMHKCLQLLAACIALYSDCILQHSAFYSRSQRLNAVPHDKAAASRMLCCWSAYL